MTTLNAIFSTELSPDETDNTFDDPKHRSPLVLHNRDFKSVTDAIANVAERPTTLGWKIAFAVSLSMLGMLGACIGYLILTGVGVWGNNQPASWGFPIVNFVFWVGIGHAGTLISAILFLFRQNWRTAINRFAEAMTIFAVMCAGLFPGIHVGRAWLAYWLFPIPNQMSMWPQFRSPLLWDVFAVGTYATVSVLFWYVGMVPDLATFRDRATGKVKQFAYGLFALGWTGSARHWHRYERAYLLLAALATPLVLSVHSVVSFDFATSQLPGWHTTVFPPYFVAGAVYGGFAMVLNLAIPARAFFGLKDIITLRHLDNCAKVMLGTGLIVAYSYSLEFWAAWYSGNHYERFGFYNRAFGPYMIPFFIMMWCNVLAPQFLWFKKVRTNMLLLFICALFANIGMWFERFEIIITSLTRDFLPSSWYAFRPSPIDILMLIGSFGLFFTMFLLFCRFLPVVAMAEVKTVMPQAHGHGDMDGDGHAREHAHDIGKSDFQPDEHFRPTAGSAPTLRGE
ncbi:MAG TPA: NrfD/PsrC family molybdoenzyme membrane anchor subunit [Tepidisphaeraceae bacterium]|jgi:molybdopterin-containing oxidoreductase family membrane subunit|nr:NrfD/PsrC family molybdoenzyme membrane anchor subunit [Tepidisphaeraceae bacterium]